MMIHYLFFFFFSKIFFINLHVYVFQVKGNGLPVTYALQPPDLKAVHRIASFFQSFS